MTRSACHGALPESSWIAFIFMDTLDGMPEPRQTWTVREIARKSGRSLGHVAAMVRGGLAPGYVPPAPGRTAHIPSAIAEDLVLVLRHGVFSSPRFAELMKSDPASAREGVDALARLVSAAEPAEEEAPAA